LGGGLQNIIREGAIKLGDFIRGDDETGFIPASKPLASPARKRSVPPRRAEYADFRRAEAEAAAKDAYTERESQFMTGTSGITDIADLAETKYAPAPGPQVGFDFQWENSSDLYMALNEQTRAIYNAEPMYRIEKYGAGLLGLHLYEDQGKLDVVSQLGFEPWVKPFTVNYLNQFPGTNVRVNEAGEIVGDVDWNYIDDDTIRRLEDLGFIAPGGGTTDGGGGGARVGGGGGGGGGGGSVRYASSGYAPRGDQLYNRGSQLALVSWSI
jgi:hypothetical protein